MNDRGFHQIAYVVRDLDVAVRHWADDLGVGPWSVWTMRTPYLKEAFYLDGPAEFGLRHALAWSGHVQIELVQPLEGPSIFRDQLDSAGEGPNHIGVIVADHEHASSGLLARGFTPLQGAKGFGRSRDGKFTYFRPPHDGGVIIELISPPTDRFDPEYVYPKAG